MQNRHRTKGQSAKGGNNSAPNERLPLPSDGLPSHAQALAASGAVRSGGNVALTNASSGPALMENQRSLYPAVLMWANKLIFVQEYDQAFELLLEHVRKDVTCTESHFRLVEVAVRIERAAELRGALSALQESHPGQLSVTLARALLEIRVLERAQGQGDDPAPVNSSTQSHAQSPRSNGSPRLLQLQGDAGQELNSLLPRSYFGLSTIETGRRGYIVGKNIRLTRSPLVADDLAPENPEDHEIRKFDSESQVQPEEDIESLRLIRQIRDEITSTLLLDHAENYAVWYVNGCLAELENSLSEAVSSWVKAHRLNPYSLAVLATLAELQQIGALDGQSNTDYVKRFEQLDPFAVHGTYQTHLALYQEFLGRGEYRLAIASLRTLADWTQRQKGEVPTELEVLCLLGAMRAFRLEGNSGAAESARREAENLTVSLKKNKGDLDALAFIGQIAEDFELPTLARMCYFSVLSHPHVSKDLVVRTAAHCVARFASRALADCLRTAYRHHGGDAEIRFCKTLCSLAIEEVPVKEYLERKNRIRELLSADQVGDALSLLQEALADIQDDAEVHYYLAEIYSRLDVVEAAERHFEKMYLNDDLNIESVSRYIQFLLKVKKYVLSQEVAQRLLRECSLNDAQAGEAYWSLAAGSFAMDKIQDANQFLEKALQCDPWNLTYLAFGLRLHYAQMPLGHSSELESLFSELEDQVLGENRPLTSLPLEKWVEKALALIDSGLSDLPFLMASVLFRHQHEIPSVQRLFFKASSAFDSRLSAQRLMMLLRLNEQVPSMGFLAYCVASVYALCGDWELVREWVDIATKSGLDSEHERSRLFELEALGLAFSGQGHKRAQNLLEAALDSYSGEERPSDELGVLHGYLILVQGDIRTGLDKINQHLGERPSIQSLYFLVKGLDRAGQLTGDDKEFITQILQRTAANRMEQKLIDEIHMLVGSIRSGALAHLTC
jgi:tetratricopeptide (TPR) repeat protein